MKRPDWTKVLTTARKFGAALLGVLTMAVTQGLIPEEWRPWAAVLVALGTALGVYSAGNAPALDRSQTH